MAPSTTRKVWFVLPLAVFVLLAASCQSEPSNPPRGNTGSIAAQVTWPQGAGISPLSAAMGALPYAPPAGVEWLRYWLTGPGMSEMSDTFDVTPGVDGSGSIDSVPAGGHRKLILEGLAADKATVLNKGITANITVTTGNTTVVPITLYLDDGSPPPEADWFAAGDGDGEVALYWGLPADPDVAGVVIRRSTTGQPASPLDGTLVYEGAGGLFIDTGLTNDVLYYYTLFVYDPWQHFSSTGVQQTAMPAGEPNPPDVPGTLSATPGNAVVHLSWTAPATGPAPTVYQIFRATSSPAPTGTSPYAVVDGGGTLAFDDTGAVNGVTYYYAVVGTNANGNGPPSYAGPATPVAAPNAVPFLEATAGNLIVHLLWDTPAGGTAPESYKVFRSQVSPVDTSGVPLDTVTAPTVSYDDNAVVNGTSYYYAVVAWHSVGGDGPASTTVGPVTPDTPPGAPSTLGASAGDCQVALSWTAPSTGGAPTDYKVYRGTSSPVSVVGVPHDTTGGTVPAYTDNSVAGGGTLYYYAVVATNAGGDSPASNEASATTQCSPGAPQNVVATPDDGFVDLSWSAPATGDAPTEYRVYRSLSEPVDTGVTPLTTVGAGTLTYHDTAVTNGTPYYYVVVAANAVGTSPASNPASAVPADVTPPANATLFRATAGDLLVDLTWIEPGDADYMGVKICYSTSGYPTDPATCTSAFDDLGTFLAHSVANGTQVYYTAFAHDEVPNYASGVRATAMPGGLKMVDAGAEFSLALRTDGTVWAWGYNIFGALGNGSTLNQFAPAPVCAPTGTTPCTTYLSGIVAVSAGQYHSLALDSSGFVWAWGDNLSGQVGDGTTSTVRYKPTQVCFEAGCGLFLNNVVAIAAGQSFSLALRDDGIQRTVWAWGLNVSGQLGNGTFTDSPLPVQVCTAHNGSNCTAYLTDVAAIATAGQTGFALKSDGTVWAWGNNGQGQLGQGTSGAGTHSPLAVQVCITYGGTCTEYLSNIADISAGLLHLVALGRDGTLWAWGYNGYGQLGDGTTFASTTAVQVDPAGGWARIGTGYNTSFGIRDDGAMWAWGKDDVGQLGEGGNIPARSTAVPVAGGIDTWGFVTAGPNHTVSLRGDGSLWSWGLNHVGQLGLGYSSKKIVPTAVGSFGDWTQIVGGYNHTLAVRIGHTLWAWGSNQSFQLGDGTSLSRELPAQVGSDIDWSKVGAGPNHSLATKLDGSLWGWGSNTNGQLGLGDFSNRLNPAKVCSAHNGFNCTAYLADVTAASGGTVHSAALLSDGTVWTFGSNQLGQLGNGALMDPTVRSNLPVQVCEDFDTGGGTCITPLTNVVAIAAGSYHTVALKSDGTVWGWGYNSNGQLADGTSTHRNVAVQACQDYDVPTSTCLTPFTVPVPTIVDGVVAAGDVSSYVVSGDGTVWAWGANSFGARGTGAVLGNAPNQVCDGFASASCTGTLTGIVSLTCGRYHCLARDSGGNVWAWGRNEFGQLGDGTTTDRYVATPVCQVYDEGAGTCTTQLAGVGAIGAGEQHSVARKTNGELWAWGSNFYGQLGDGTGWEEFPVQVLLPP